MEIIEAKEKKIEIQELFKKLLNEFERETGLEIYTIQIDRIEWTAKHSKIKKVEIITFLK